MEPSESNNLESLRKSREKRFNSGSSSKFTTAAVSQFIEEEKQNKEQKLEESADNNFKLKRQDKYLFKKSLEISSNSSVSTVYLEEINKSKTKDKGIQETNNKWEDKSFDNKKELKNKKIWKSKRSEYYLRIVKHYLSNN